MNVDYTTEVAGAILSEIEASVVPEADLWAGIKDPGLVVKLKRALREGSISRADLVRAAELRKAPKTARRKPTRVYFIVAEATGLIKIGSSADPAARLRTLQTGCPDRLTLIGSIPGDERVERDLHRQFSAARVRGEWFTPTSDLARFIERATR